MTIEEVIFYVLATGAGVGGLGVVLSRNIVYSALALILSLMSVAGIFILLSAEFLGLVQILVYGGAVTIIILFAMMLTRVRDLPRAINGPQWPLAAAVASVFLAVSTIAAVSSQWPGDTENPNVIPLRTLGDSLFRQWSVPFEVASLVLVVALIGAIVIAGREESE
jgi:NADH-quinone oxidoreductase subunit J